MTALPSSATLRFGPLSVLWFGVMLLAPWVNHFFRRDNIDPLRQCGSVGFAWGLLFCATWVAISPGSWWLRLPVAWTSLIASARIVMDETGSGFSRTVLIFGMVAGSTFIGLTLGKVSLWNMDQAVKPRTQFTIFGLLVLTTAIALWMALAVKFPLIDLTLPQREFLIAITALSGTFAVKLELSALDWWQRILLVLSIAGVWLFVVWVLVGGRSYFEWKGFGIFLTIYLLTIVVTTNLGKLDSYDEDCPLPQ